MITRDSHLWWLVMAGGVLTAMAADPAMVSDLVSGDKEKMAQAIVKFLGLIVAAGAGVARMSPLPISEQGRADAIERKVASAETASVAAAVAAQASSAAAEQATVAVQAAKVASVESTKAADTVDE